MLTSILQVQVAVKKLKPHVLSNAVDLREFLSEANTLRRLKHRSAKLCCKHMRAVHTCFIYQLHLLMGPMLYMPNASGMSTCLSNYVVQHCAQRHQELQELGKLQLCLVNIW